MDRLTRARSYDRIAGYFSSSMLEVAGEALETISGPIRLVCNSDLDLRDVETAKAANYALRREWCASEPEKYGPKARVRFSRLFDFLRFGKLRVKVLPREKFGLVHGKAGVITLEDGQKTSFVGSTNETYDAWRLHYELLWEDDSPEAVQWVQEEFDALWNSLFAVWLADFIVEDVGRLARRTVVPNVEGWRAEPDPAAPIIESPVYRQEYGLWAHQKYFVKLAFDAHQGPYGARFVLADMVGLGKTLQLAMAAQLMTLYGTKPVLILTPKTLVWQWQGEMKTLLDMPSAVWTGKQWVDENGIEYPTVGPEGIKKCPRRVGIVSQGLITAKSEAADHLKGLRYECVIVDEAHRARRNNLGLNRENESADPNNLLAFLYEISPRTRSLLLATATPVQLYPLEAWDLLSILAAGETNEPYLKPVKVELLGESDAESIRLPPYLQDAYSLAEEFCRMIGARARGAGFLKTLLLRRVGSTMYAGSVTAETLLGTWQDIPEREEEEEDEELMDEQELRTLTPSEREKLQAFGDALHANQERDPKYNAIVHCLLNRGWLDQGCIVFSQYFDSIWWLAQQLVREIPGEAIGIHAGGQRSGIMKAGEFTRIRREDLKRMVFQGELRLLLGTDAASEGLNLQRLGTLINLDLPWNPTRLEQRKGRIQRIGQLRDTVFVYNMRYKGSVEDRVHELLSDRLEDVYRLFGQIPDVLEEVWVQVALGEIERAKQTINAVPKQHPFEIKYNKIDTTWKVRGS